jgi:predicted dehydrogenase
MRALVVGLGHMGRFHRDTLLNLGYEVHAVDPRWTGSTDPKLRADFFSIDGALLHFKYDVACVAVPIDQLVSCAFQLAGIPMLVEKPFAPSAQEAAMLASYLMARAPVAVGYLERFNPQARELKRKLSDRHVHVRAARFIRYSDRPSPNPVIDLLTHDVDLARYLFADHWGDRTVSLCSFDYKDEQEQKVRRIEVDVNVRDMSTARDIVHGTARDETWVVDLMDHDLKPTYAEWFSFLNPELAEVKVASPEDAVQALQGAAAVERQNRQKVVAAR